MLTTTTTSTTTALQNKAKVGLTLRQQHQTGNWGSRLMLLQQKCSRLMLYVHSVQLASAKDTKECTQWIATQNGKISYLRCVRAV